MTLKAMLASNPDVLAVSPVSKRRRKNTRLIDQENSRVVDHCVSAKVGDETDHAHFAPRATTASSPRQIYLSIAVRRPEDPRSP